MDQMIGKVIDTYKILEVLGRGGMGVVYRAVDTQLDRDVAVKMMDVMIATDPNFLKRFQSEAKALAKLQNPNIVSIFALRETEFGVCIVMEFVKGKTLGDLLKQSTVLPIPRVIHIFKQVLTALDHAHKGGVIHRDIKPGNVMLAEGDVVKVTDFGLAKIQKGTVSTMTMGTAGTLYYMSPEQIRGLSNVDHRGDIYSAGMALYESLTGRVPFKSDDSDFIVAQIIVEGKIPPPDKMNPGLPKELVKIVMKSIDKDPLKRYQSAAEMVTALDRFGSTLKPGEYRMSVAPTMVSAGPGPLPPPAPPRKELNWKLYGGIAAAAVVLLVTYFVLRPFVFSEEGTLTVKTNPAGGKVYIDNVLAEKLPVENYPLAAGTRRVSVLWGQSRLDTSVAITPGNPVTLVLAMRKAAEPAKTTTEPPPTDVSRVETGDVSHVVEPERREAATGVLVLEAVPDGEVKVDDASYRNADGPGARVTVQPGARTVTFRKGGLTKQTTIRVGAGETNGLKCYFSGTVNVVASPAGGTGTIWGYVVVDGTRQEVTTPATLPLAAGRHRISVTRQGYVAVPAEKVVTIEPSFEGPAVKYQVAFKLKQQ